MGKDARKAYLLAIRKRYHHSDKAAKQIILNEFCSVCGYCRKYAIRLLNRKTKSKSSTKRPGPKPKYRAELMLEPLRRIWFTSDQPCGKRLKAAIPLWLPHYETHFGALEAAIRNDLLSISAASLDRLLKPLRLSHPKGLSGTKPGSLLKNQIPIRTHFWDETLPGFVEADTVAHCGHSLSGDFVWSLTMTDCNDPVNSCSGVNLLGDTNEHGNGRRNQTLDQSQKERLGHGNLSGQNDCC